MASEVAPNVGFGRSDVKSYVIPSGGTSTERVDLERPYAFIVIMCENLAGIASGNMFLNVSPEEGIPLHRVYEQNSATAWNTGTLPTSGTFYLLCTHAFGARFVQPVLSAASDAELTFKILGYDPTVVGQANI